MICTTYDKAKCEPRLRPDDVSAVVSAVVAATHDAFVALDFLAESRLAAGENETHLGSLFLIRVGNVGTVIWCRRGRVQSAIQ